MLPATNSTTFCFYSISVLVLCANLIFLWMYSAVARSKEKVSPNPEDAPLAAGTVVSQETPSHTARVLRAHANAEASIYPFLFLGLIYTFSGGGPTTAAITFGIFCLARWLHSFCYLAGKQPHRTIAFLTGIIVIIALMIEIIVTMAQH